MSFDDRQKAFENKYKHDEELRFKVEVKAAKLLGLWAGAQLAKTGDALSAYALEAAAAQMEKAGNDDVIDKIEQDLRGANVAVTRNAVAVKMDECLNEAKKVVMGEG